MYHGIILDLEFKNSSVINKFKIFAQRKSVDASRILYGIEVKDTDIYKTIKVIQENLKRDEPYYAHLYNNKELIIIFKKKVFHVSPKKYTWKEFIEYGIKLGISSHQLQVKPTRFAEEDRYFSLK